MHRSPSSRVQTRFKIGTEMKEAGLALESQGLNPRKLCYLLAVALYEFPLQ